MYPAPAAGVWPHLDVGDFWPEPDMPLQHYAKKDFCCNIADRGRVVTNGGEKINTCGDKGVFYCTVAAMVTCGSANQVTFICKLQASDGRLQINGMQGCCRAW